MLFLGFAVPVLEGVTDAPAFAEPDAEEVTAPAAMAPLEPGPGLAIPLALAVESKFLLGAFGGGLDGADRDADWESGADFIRGREMSALSVRFEGGFIDLSKK